MASLRHVPRSPYWVACFSLPDGTRTNRSTKTTDRRKAERIAQEWEDAAKKASEGRLVESQARKVLNDILEKTFQDPISSETVEGFLRNWLKGKTNDRTAERYRHAVNLFLQGLGRKAKAVLGAVQHQDVLAFMDARLQSGAAPKTLSVDVKILNTAFNLARRLGHIQTNPVEKALALRPINVESSEKVSFTPDQIAKLLKSATGDWQTAILLGYYLGARLSDCANMKWENVNMALHVFDYQQQKTGKRVVVPIHPELESHLQKHLPAAKTEAHLCPKLTGKETGGKSGLSEKFKQIMKAAGVNSQTAQGKGRRQFSKLSFHSLRHSFNSHLANAGVDQETRMALTGHSSVEINNDYTKFDLPVLSTAIQKLPSLPK